MNGSSKSGPQIPQSGKFPDFPGMIARLHDLGFPRGVQTYFRTFFYIFRPREAKNPI